MTGERLYVAVSIDNDECALNNRAFWNWQDARSYAAKVNTNSGCIMMVRSVLIPEKKK